MRTLTLIVALALIGSLTAADPKPPALPPKIEKLPPRFDPDKMADKEEAKKAAAWLEEAYPDSPRPEGVQMLIAILRGSQLNGTDGWFGPAQSRYTFPWLAKRAGADAKAGVTKETFGGPAALFDRLDRDGDGKVTQADLDWSDRNPWVMQARMVNQLFRRMDWSGDGRMTREEMDKFFEMVSQGKDHVTPEDLRRAMIPRGPAGFSPGDGPSVPVLVRGLFAGEIGSIGEGPKVGDAAPDFTLKTVDGKEAVTLSKLVGPKPLVLVFGNFTCGPYRALYPEIEALHQRYKDQATFLMVYVREAHPVDGWHMESNARSGVKIKQPTTFDERVKVSDQFCQKLKPSMPVVVDEIDDRAGHAYSGMPGRMYVIDPQGKVAYKSGRGPFGFKSGELEQALVMALVESGKKQ